MPRIRRFFPLAHDVNEDPILWAMTREFGDRSMRLYLEIESVSDRNGGYLPIFSDACAKALAGRCQLSKKTVMGVWGYLVDQSRIICDPVPRMANYSDFHHSRDAKEIPQRIDLDSSPPSLPSEPSEPTFKEPPSAAIKKSKELPEIIKEEVGKLLSSPAGMTRFSRLPKWIQRKQDEHCDDRDIAAALKNLRERERKLGQVDDFWGYLDTKNGGAQDAVSRAMTRRLQDESKAYKRSESTKLGDVRIGDMTISELVSKGDS